MSMHRKVEIDDEVYVKKELYDEARRSGENRYQEVLTLKQEVERLKGRASDGFKRGYARGANLSTPAAPVVWVKYDKQLNHWWLTDAKGGSLTGKRFWTGFSKPEHAIQDFKERFGCEPEVRIYPDDSNSYSGVEAVLKQAFQDAKDGVISGYEASMIKWNALIAWCKATGEKPPYAGQCGLCALHDSCSGCPIRCNGDIWKALSTPNPTEWLKAAKEFRQYIVEKAGPNQKPTPAHEWVYGVWKYLSSSNGEPIGHFASHHNRASGWSDKGMPYVIELCINNRCINAPICGLTIPPNDTPIFGVRRLGEGEKRQYGVTHTGVDYTPFYNGKPIMYPKGSVSYGASYPIHCLNPETAIQVVLDALTPSQPATTLADLEVVG